MNLQEIQTALDMYSKTGIKASTLFGAAAEIIKILSDHGTSPQRLFTGDPVADSAILRAAGVEQVIKTRWNMDLESVIEFVMLLASAGTALEPMFRKKQ